MQPPGRRSSTPARPWGLFAAPLLPAFRRLHRHLLRPPQVLVQPSHPPLALLSPLPPSQPGAKQPTAAELSEAEQEALLRAKYGGLLKKKPLLPQDRKHFDSADWQLSKQGVPAERPQLEPKLNPTVPPARRSSQLGDGL